MHSIAAAWYESHGTEQPEVNLILEHSASKGEGLLESASVEGPGSERKGSPCYYRSYNDALCTTPRQDWSISHCNEVAHRLHQWQGIYRFNLYNESNLFLSATCFLPGTDSSKASRHRGGSGSKIRWMWCVHVCCGGGGGCCRQEWGWEVRRTWDEAENIGRGKAKIQEVERRERFMWHPGMCLCHSCR